MKQNFDNFRKILRGWWFSQIRDLDIGPDVLKALRNPAAPLSERDFKVHLARAILDATFSVEDYESLTEMDFETTEEVVCDLREFWHRIFGNESIEQFGNINLR
jgi:hypothetical protein